LTLTLTLTLTLILTLTLTTCSSLCLVACCTWCCCSCHFFFFFCCCLRFCFFLLPEVCSGGCSGCPRARYRASLRNLYRALRSWSVWEPFLGFVCAASIIPSFFASPFRLFLPGLLLQAFTNRSSLVMSRTARYCA